MYSFASKKCISCLNGLVATMFFVFFKLYSQITQRCREKERRWKSDPNLLAEVERHGPGLSMKSPHLSQASWFPSLWGVHAIFIHVLFSPHLCRIPVTGNPQPSSLNINIWESHEEAWEWGSLLLESFCLPNVLSSQYYFPEMPRDPLHFPRGSH